MQITIKSTLVLFFLILLSSCRRGPVEIRCGGAANYICPPGMFCSLIENCGGIDKDGICQPIPEDCPHDVTPVCGCDGVTYDNSCWAALKQRSIKYQGNCQNPASK